jgi:hypothetical protein
MSDRRIASNDLTVWTYDWVPEGPRGHVRDIRLRWALEEAGLDYAVRTVPFDDRGPEHLAHQPFGQVPFLEDGDIILFESGVSGYHTVTSYDRSITVDVTMSQRLVSYASAIPAPIKTGVVLGILGAIGAALLGRWKGWWRRIWARLRTRSGSNAASRAIPQKFL